MAMASPQKSTNIMSMAIRDAQRGLYQVAFNDGVSGVRVEVPFDEANSVREARVRAEHTLAYQEWLRGKRLREHRVRQTLTELTQDPGPAATPGRDDLTGVDPDGLADRLIDRYAVEERDAVAYGVGAMLRHTLVIVEAAHRLNDDGAWTVSNAFRVLEDLRLMRHLGSRLNNADVERDPRLADAVHYWNAVRDGHLAPQVRDQLRRRAKVWLQRHLRDEGPDY
jgi:hypothetical protein